jgi:hypothetical protein
MDITPYVETLRGQLLAAAETESEEARRLAERLTAALDPAARLALLDALSDAAGEITEELAPGSVDVRLRGGEPDFVVTRPAAEPVENRSGSTASASPSEVAPQDAPEIEDGATARITLRLPEHLKPRIEEAAKGESLSVNAWLVRAVSTALDPAAQERRSTRSPGPHLGQSITGWAH